MKILIVDDAKMMRDLIKNALRKLPDLIIYEAVNGEEAIQIYMAVKPDLVTMDITMDVMDGVEASKRILKDDSSAKIIMVTALGQVRLLEECIAAGAQDFIVKPFTMHRILSAVTKALDITIPLDEQ